MKSGWECWVVLGRREYEGMRCVLRRRDERGVREREGIVVACRWVGRLVGRLEEVGGFCIYKTVPPVRFGD